ncbi:DNA/RNA helicase domain-containing protein [Allokutzneria sp. NRRL B-24872]|uniref:DNA/RNA helicase domain-containing protein n=1 Tax=Allokutzneria sp. NRRL B-24872 TaxID=1137961 RepID=UPI000A396113|nr:DNA/RNA helicase domain-containing protein [Allokutzneria sp. NRRL B-24872]
MQHAVGSVRSLWDLGAEELARLLSAGAQRASFSAKNAEKLSWERSLWLFLGQLVEEGFGEVHVLAERRLPYSSRRIDLILCGLSPEDRLPSYVLVELKQWTDVVFIDGGLARFGRSGTIRLDPLEQVTQYRRYLLDFVPSLARCSDMVHAVAYLHNEIAPARESGDAYTGLYFKNNRAGLMKRLGGVLDRAPGLAEAAERCAEALMSAVAAPSGPMLWFSGQEIRRRDRFVLLDEQQVAFRTVLRELDDKAGNGRKKVVVVVGGPGSGKSALALSLMDTLAHQRRRVMHATGSKAFTESLRKVTTRETGRAKELFKYFFDFREHAENHLEVLICDEAHRVRNTDTGGGSQIDSLIRVASVPVFLLDEHQAVRHSEIGTVNRIAEAAANNDCDLVKIELNGQFRYGGSALYDEWVLRLLGLADGEPIAWSDLVAGQEDDFAVRFKSTPHAMEDWLRSQEANVSGTARIAAGFSWPWTDPQEGKLVNDVVIGDWHRPWNAKQKFAVEGVPSASHWSFGDKGFGQVGCVYTAQGFEYDWAGVIFGEDLVVRRGRWRAQLGKSCDHGAFSGLRGSQSTVERTAARLILNSYKVLLTRALRGVCVYSVDQETAEYLREHAR